MATTVSLRNLDGKRESQGCESHVCCHPGKPYLRLDAVTWIPTGHRRSSPAARGPWLSTGHRLSAKTSGGQQPRAVALRQFRMASLVHNCLSGAATPPEVQFLLKGSQARLQIFQTRLQISHTRLHLPKFLVSLGPRGGPPSPVRPVGDGTKCPAHCDDACSDRGHILDVHRHSDLPATFASTSALIPCSPEGRPVRASSAGLPRSCHSLSRDHPS
jgi:hypothetical protein